MLEPKIWNKPVIYTPLYIPVIRIDYSLSLQLRRVAFIFPEYNIILTYCSIYLYLIPQRKCATLKWPTKVVSIIIGNHNLPTANEMSNPW